MIYWPVVIRADGGWLWPGGLPLSRVPPEPVLYEPPISRRAANRPGTGYPGPAALVRRLSRSHDAEQATNLVGAGRADALLADDVERHEVLYAQLDRAEARTGYAALVAAAFCEAVERRFPRDHQHGDVITFVASVRTRSDRLATEIAPRTAERIIRAVSGDGSIADLSDATVAGTQIVLLAALIADEQLDDAGLDAFLGSARKLADQLMG
jgi:hypothetical protein